MGRKKLNAYYQSIELSEEIILRRLKRKMEGLLKQYSDEDIIDPPNGSMEVDGKDAVYEDGTIIGNMSDEDFVDTQEGAMADVKWKTINLYFANKSGDALVKNSKRICYNKNVSVEKVVMEQLIKGTTESGCYQSKSIAPQNLPGAGRSGISGRQ